jgi:hypothetical protein
LHDGSALTLAAVFDTTNAINGSPHASFRTLNSTQQNELIEYLLELDGSEPAAPPVIPQLGISPAGNSVLLTWPQTAIGFELYSSATLDPVPSWVQVTNTVQQTGGVFTVTLPLNGDRRFFRLQSN